MTISLDFYTTKNKADSGFGGDTMSVSETVSSFIPLVILVNFIEFLIAGISVYSLVKYLIVRYRRGVVSTFMLSLCFFLFHFMLEILTILIWEILSLLNIDGNFKGSLSIYILWLVSSLGISASITLMGFFIVKKKFDIYITREEKTTL